MWIALGGGYLLQNKGFLGKKSGRKANYRQNQIESGKTLSRHNS